VRAIVPPTVPRGTERVRVCLHAGNTVEEIDGLVKRIGEWVVAQGLTDQREAKL
jgi:8-amino-7-oxononanoate synthase